MTAPASVELLRTWRHPVYTEPAHPAQPDMTRCYIQGGTNLEAPCLGCHMAVLSAGALDALVAEKVTALADDEAFADAVRAQFLEQPYDEHHAAPWVRAVAIALTGRATS